MIRYDRPVEVIARGMPLVALISGLASGCFEFSLSPPWVVDGPTVLVSRVEVIIPGSNSDALPPVWTGEVRANPLPGDRIRIHSFIVAPPEVEVDETVFLACSPGAECIAEDWRELSDCADAPWPLLPEEDPCRISRFDGEVELALPAFRALDQEQLDTLGARGLLSFEVRVFAGTIGTIETQECVDRYARRDASLFDCAIDRFSVSFQQGQALLDALAPVGVSLGIDTAAVPSDWLDQEPNVHPILVATPFRVDGVVHDLVDGDILEVAPGTAVRIDAARTTRDQSFATIGTDHFSQWEEIPDAGLWLDTPTMLLADSEEFSPTAFVMPDVEQMRVFTTVVDGRGGVTWASYELRSPS
jgi:hypothetical protein